MKQNHVEPTRNPSAAVGQPSGRRRGAAADRGATPGALTTADLVVLGLLAERPMHGYAVVREYERQEVADWAAVSRPHVYYALAKLARRSLVVPVGEPVSAVATGRRRTVFAPSAAGHQALADRLADVAWAHARQPDPFTTWLGLSIHGRPAEVRIILEAYLQGELAREEATLPLVQNDPSPRAAVGIHMVELRIRQLRVELDWLDNLGR